jgi:hypothetical protein
MLANLKGLLMVWEGKPKQKYNYPLQGNIEFVYLKNKPALLSPRNFL